jgi:hypothetical protein
MNEKAPVVVFEAEAGQEGRLRAALPGAECRFVEQVLSDQTIDRATRPWCRSSSARR